MNTWITSDLHIGHYTDEKRNILKYSNRPFSSIRKMNQTIQDNWNALISEDDIVYNLGDYIFKVEEDEWFRLNGRQILIRGNHDRYSATKLKEKFGIEVIHKKPIKISYNGHDIKLMHSPVHKENNCVNFCGHVHDMWKYEDGVYNVGVDNHDFRPILLDEAINRYFWHINYKESTTENETIY